MQKTIIVNLDEVSDNKSREVSLTLVENALARMGYYVFNRINKSVTSERDQRIINDIIEHATLGIHTGARILPKVVTPNLICLFFYI